MPPKRKNDDALDLQRQRKKPATGRGDESSSSFSCRSYNPSALQEDFLSYSDHSKELALKADHEHRPLWISKDKLIFLEAFSPLYQQACDFLVAIAEPESRPEFIHIYRLTENSLNAAVALSIDADSIIKVLTRLCKTEVPKDVIRFIKDSTQTFGKAKIVLKNNIYFIESKYPEVLRALLGNPIIAEARLKSLPTTSNSSQQTNNSSHTNNNNTNNNTNNKTNNDNTTTDSSSVHYNNTVAVLTVNDYFLESSAPLEDRRNLDITRIGDADNDEEEEDEEGHYPNEGGGSSFTTSKTVSFMLKQGTARAVKKTAKEESKYPLMEEYDFKHDLRNPNLDIHLRPSTKIRPYQEKSLSKMFGNGRARSGIIVLPCGAGKSLTGVTAASTIKKSCVVMCINNASVSQWKQQFLMWTTISEKAVKLFTSTEKDTLPLEHEACVIISTYSMICKSGNRSASGELLIKAITSREWGLMILDEVHVAPADMFQKVVDLINAHCKLGLTATLVREDNKIQDLPSLVGPKLYEANWIDLTNQGYLAKVMCAEVWCPMTKEFFSEYIRNSVSGKSRLQRLLYVLNPRKFRMCEFLVKYHAEKGHKIIIFSDDVPALWLYCEALRPLMAIPYIFGDTSEPVRRDILTAFKTSSEVNCIGLSKVGDTALDIPEANVIIQVSSHFGARRQEAQRLGRILRPKPNPTGGYNAFFYTLISTDTKEMFFSNKRQQYLIDQGYTFKVLQDLTTRADAESKILRNAQDEIALLHKVLEMDFEKYDVAEEKALTKVFEGEVEEEEIGSAPSSGSHRVSQSHSQRGNGGNELRTRVSNLSSLSGSGSVFYTER